MTDLILAIAHHLLVFGLATQLAMESALVRPGITPAQVRTVGRLDAGYGATAALVLVIGVLRVAFGAKGWSWYADNPWFWGKMAAFAVVGLASIPPTIRFLRWRRGVAADPAYVPHAEEVANTRRWLGLQALALVAVLAFAATMARYG